MSEYGEEDDNASDASSLVGGGNGSVTSTSTNRFGFLRPRDGADSPEPKQIVSASTLLKRERKWLNMMGNWHTMMSKNYRKVRERCRKGIPPSVRHGAWLHLSGAKEDKRKHPESYFEDLCAREGNPRYIEDIRKDLHRQFPNHEIFREQEGHGQKDLFCVLKAYSIKEPSVGYCQAQAPIAAFLLMFMPAEDAFWCLVEICDKYLKGYYSQGMETLQIDGDMLFAFLKKFSPHIHKHLKKQKIEPILYMTEWFLCVFTRTLPWPALLRVWDMFLCEGPAVLFKVALILMNICLRSSSRTASSLKKRYPTMYETLEALRNPPMNLLEEDFLVKHILRINLTAEEMRAEHDHQRSKRSAVQNKAK